MRIMFRIALFLLVLSCLLISCGSSDEIEEEKKSGLIINRYKVPFYFSAGRVLECGQAIFCLDHRGRLIGLNRSYDVIYDFRDSAGSFYVHGIHVSGDSLYFTESDNQTIKLTHFLDEKFRVHACDAELRKQAAYEDSSYRIGVCCFGTYKGSIFFTSKLNGETYSIPASCAVAVNRSESGYLISLSSEIDYHSQSSLLEIPDPTKLYKLDKNASPGYPESVYYYCNWWREIIDNGGEEKLKQGYRKVYEIDSVITMGSFMVNDKLFHLCCSENKTFIGASEGNNFIEYDSLLGKRIYKGMEAVNMRGPLIRYFDDPSLAGFIRIVADSVHVVRFEKSRR